MNQRLDLVGAGIAGCACALALRRAQPDLQFNWLERAPQLEAIGAGVQLGPNVMRRLIDWGLGDALARITFSPQDLRIMDAHTGKPLGRLELGQRALEQYGAPYACIHRGDLQQVLLAAAMQLGDGPTLGKAWADPSASFVSDGGLMQAQADHQALGVMQAMRPLIACDGGLSAVRQAFWGVSAARETGHWAYRALLPMDKVPRAWSTQGVQVWWGKQLHVVVYPVSAGQFLNVVWVQSTQAQSSADEALQQAQTDAQQSSLCSALRDALQSVEQWLTWPILAGQAIQGPQDMARGVVALVGDAAHPMRPYLAQGAGMAIEDAYALGHLWQQTQATRIDQIESLWQSYAQARWQRNAKVQRKSKSNGRLFHASGVLRWARDGAMRVLGERLMDQPWLYRG